MEVGTHSPWISRFLSDKCHEVVVANSRKLRLIYSNPRKCDELDARMLAKVVRVDKELLHPIKHCSASGQRAKISLKLRANLVKQRVAIILCLRGILKSMGTRLKSTTTAAFAKSVETQLNDEPELLAHLEPSLKVLCELQKFLVSP